MEPKAIERTHEVKGFDERRDRLRTRILVLNALTSLTNRGIAAKLGVDSTLITHMLSGRRNTTLGTYIDEMEAIVDAAEAAAKRDGVRLPK